MRKTLNAVNSREKGNRDGGEVGKEVGRDEVPEVIHALVQKI